MLSLLETKESEEKVILVGVCLNEKDNIEESLDELKELVKTADATVVGRLVQNREAFHSATYIGKGKIEELKELALETGATGIVCDDELSPAQIRNLEEALDLKIMDRTLVILDIFSKRALTKEGMIQVELAQLKYRSSRLVGLRSSLSRLGGGIGSKGPGEKKLELDRRLIRNRIAQLSKELEEVKMHRVVQRKQRSKNLIPVVCIVGYTNAGKSTLLNRLTQAGVLEEDQLFATLDPTTRKLELESGQEIMLTDTVGFIRKLPHHLVDAFRSTLEEAKYSDLILHVVDMSNPQMDQQMEAVYETLDRLDIRDKTIITVFNKQDKVEKLQIIKDAKADRTVRISAKKEEGFEELLQTIEEILQSRKQLIEKVYPYDQGSTLQIIRKYGQILEEEYLPEGTKIKAYIPKEWVNRV
ncbi:MAG: GTPase HflX [Lachnospiraceae bacterium]|nr:GTPase HflX [Lachnospiraceae bacterium]